MASATWLVMKDLASSFVGGLSLMFENASRLVLKLLLTICEKELFFCDQRITLCLAAAIR